MQEAVTSRTKPSLMKLVAKKVKEKESLGLYESSVDIENAVNIDYGANPHWKRGHRCWEAKGEAAQQYKSMESSLLNELNQSRKESFCEVCISLFMIGKSPRHAKPIILISSEDKRSRQEAKAALDSSGILEDTGFKIGVLKYLPSGPIHPVASIRDGSLDGTALYRSPSSSSSSEPTRSALSSNFAYYNLNRDLQAIGMPIYVKTDENVVRMATANLLYNGKGYGYMTAAHIFDGWTKASSNKDDGEGDLVDGIPFDSDSDTDGDFYDEEYIPTPQNLRSTKAVSSKPQASRVHGTWLGKSQGASSETFLVDDEARSELVVLGRVSTSQKDLDFAIITVNDSKLEKQLDNLTSSGDRQHDRLSATKPFPSKVTAFTTHGPVDGASFHVPTLIRLPGSDRYRSLYGFTYEGSIEVGDCGSLVFSKDSRSLYGMIIAASDKEPIAYVVAGDQIVQSIAEVGQWRMLHMDRDPNMRNLFKRFVPHSTPTKIMTSNSSTKDDQQIQKISDEYLTPIVKISENAEDGYFPENVTKLCRIFVEFRAIFESIESKEIRLSTTNDQLRAKMDRYASPILEYLKNYQAGQALPRNQLEESANYFCQFAQNDIKATFEETKRLRQAYEGLMRGLNAEQRPTNAQHNYSMGTGAQFIASNQNNNSGSGFQFNGTVSNFHNNGQDGSRST